MGNCMYCGKPVGLLQGKHKECNQKNQKGREKILSLVRGVRSKSSSLNRLEGDIASIATASFIDKQELSNLIAAGWEQIVEDVFDDGVLTAQEESLLAEIQNRFSLSQHALDKNGAMTKVTKGAVIREILNGKIPSRIKVDETLPFNLQRSESLVWLFQSVDYYEQRTRTRYVGGSRGVSIRIAKGFYYRMGNFKGERIKSSETVHADTGLLGITNKHIYFAGAAKRFRVAYSKIVAFEPYSDGIGIQKDTASAKPQTFATGDGWFTYNLVKNLAQM